MCSLDPRQENILKILISEYIETAEPISSEKITAKLNTRVSSATVRNEIAEMEAFGYIEKPHISSGRIPSDLGYRYYVDSLLSISCPQVSTRRKMQLIANEGSVLESMLQQVIQVLSETTNLLSAAVIYHNHDVKIFHVTLTRLSSKQLLLLLVLDNAQVINKVLVLEANISSEQVDETNQYIAKKLINATLNELKNIFLLPGSPDHCMSTNELSHKLGQMLRQIAKDLTKGDIITRGKENMFKQPESKYQESYLQNLKESISDNSILLKALTDSNAPECRVTIGKEHSNSCLQTFSFLKQEFYLGAKQIGCLAIIGPTRLSYQAYIPLLGCAAKSITDSLNMYISS